jgi:DNA helicase-2/ATP-dependent DNA helicase PcrA
MRELPGDTYEHAYSRLNQKQKEAVDTIEGPVMVVAGPGTGKTQILTLRIANILKQTQMNPENILALTFTKSGAKAIRERLRSFVGTTAYRVPIFTFHGLAERLIREYPEVYTKIIGGKPATEIEKIEIIETILETPELSLLRPTGAPQFYVSPLLSIISSMKQENVLPDDLARLIATQESELDAIPQFHEKGAHKGKERSEYTKMVASLEKQRALLTVYRLYETMMRERSRYDFDDMILETVRVLKEHESVRLDLQETYQYILADEHQDVNGAQNEILVQLTSYHENPNLFVVGDEKQAIYRFQGASLENFLYFEKLFPSTHVIVLTDNYRSTQPILDASQALVEVADGPLRDYRLPLTAFSQHETQLSLKQFGSVQQEDLSLIELVSKLVAEGVTPHEIAVIVRSNREVEALAEALTTAGVPVEASADSDILEHPLFRAMIDLIEAVLKPTDMQVLSQVFASPYWGISPADQVTVLAGCNYTTSLASRLADAAWMEESGIREPDKITRIPRVLDTVRVQALTASPHRLLATLLNESGFLPYVVAHEPVGSARVIRRVYDEVESAVRNGEVVTLADVVGVMRRRMEHRVPLSAPYLKTTSSAVQVMTAHKSKGLEFAYVFIPHVTDAIWGSGGRPQYFKVPLMRTATLALEANEDERRLLYVAMTRAKQSLFLSYAEQSADGKVLSPSPLLATFDTLVPPEPVIPIDPDVLLPKSRPVTADFEAIRQLLITTLQERGLSATSLNNCLKNPWNYFYRNVVRVPEVKTLPLLFGTAMHGVLEYATRSYTKSGTVPSFSDARLMLERQLSLLPVNTLEYSDLFEKGQTVLAAYLPHLATTLPPATREELAIRVSIKTEEAAMPELTLTGKLDRIDIRDGHAIRVVDYKTGKPKSRNEIEGKTAKADASYRRQLSFYSLLLDLHGDERYQAEVGVLSFIEPDSKGRIHEEAFVSGPDDRASIVNDINQAVAMIVSGDFLRDEALLAQSDYAHIGHSLLRQLLS